MSYTQTYVGTMIIITCPNDGCGVAFGITDGFKQRRRNDHESFYCPNGHSMSYSEKTEEERLREENANLTQRLERKQELVTELNQTIQGHKFTIRAIKAAKTKIMNRVKHGVCPCCRRSFSDLQKHFQSKHSELFNTKPKTHGKKKNS